MRMDSSVCAIIVPNHCEVLMHIACMCSIGRSLARSVASHGIMYCFWNESSHIVFFTLFDLAISSAAIENSKCPLVQPARSLICSSSRLGRWTLFCTRKHTHTHTQGCFHFNFHLFLLELHTYYSNKYNL